MKYNTFTFYRQRDRKHEGSETLQARAWSRMLEQLDREGARPVGEPVFRWEWALKVSVETDRMGDRDRSQAGYQEAAS